jgi:hypothetical protein
MSGSLGEGANMSDGLIEQRVDCRKCRYRFAVRVELAGGWRIEAQCPSCDTWNDFTVDDIVDPLKIRSEPNIAGSELWNCPNLLAFRCPQRWDALSPTNSPGVRSCSACQREVHRCETAEDFIRHGRLGHCVAIPEELTPGARTGGWLGEPSEEAVRESELSNQHIHEFWSKVIGTTGAIDPKQSRKLLELF